MTAIAPTPLRPARVLVDPWPPEQGPSYDPDDELTTPDLDLGVELPEAAWEPLAPPAGTVPARDVVLVDGVQRADARITLVPASEDDAITGIAASFAAGSIRCSPTGASFGDWQVVRGVFARAHDVSLECGQGIRYTPFAVADARGDRLHLAVTEQMRALERGLVRRVTDAELVVVDGPLSGGRVAGGSTSVPLLGLVKTHRRHFLPESHRQVVAALGPGERTPLFGTSTNYTRVSWYLRLPGDAVHPWAGVVRLEVPSDVPLSAAVELADRSAATLPRFASQPHRDARAPQNLVPIGALETRLRHLLGDPAVLERLLRRTCAAWSA